MALKMIIDEIKSASDGERITICYIANKFVVKDFYASVGFQEIGMDEYGQIIGEIKIHVSE